MWQMGWGREIFIISKIFEVVLVLSWKLLENYNPLVELLNFGCCANDILEKYHTLIYVAARIELFQSLHISLLYIDLIE